MANNIFAPVFGGNNYRAGQDGTAAAPAFGFASEAGLGIYRSSSGVLGFAVASGLVMSVQAGGATIAGQLQLGGTTVTTSTPALSLTQTWNAGAVAFTALNVAVTNTASLTTSRLFSGTVGGTDQFYVTRAGQAWANNFYLVNDGYIGHGTKSMLGFFTDGYIRLLNQAATGFTGLQFGGSTSSFPMLKREGTLLSNKLADEGGYSFFKGTGFAHVTYLVANLPAAASSTGYAAMVTNALAPTFGAVVAGGGAVTTPVYSDGTNWLVG